MSITSGFFNSVPSGSNYDREVGAEFFTELLKAGFKSGIMPDSFIASAGSGLDLNVTAGKGFINGVFFYDDSPTTIACTQATGTRKDLLVARLSVTGRTVELAVKEGTTTAADNEIAAALITITGSSITAVSNYPRSNCINMDSSIPTVYVQQTQPTNPATGDLWLW